MNYYEFNIGDYRRRTVHLQPMEHYIYRMLLDWYMLDEMPLRADTGYLLRLLSLTKRQERLLLNVLDEFFVLGEDGCYHNKRADESIAVYQSHVENGKKGGRPKKADKDTQVSEMEPEAIQTKTDLKPNQNPTETQLKPNQKATNNQEPITNITSSSSSYARDVFVMFGDWLPDEAVMAARLRSAGLPGMGSDEYRTGLHEFRLYWQMRPDKLLTQAEWEHRLLRSLLDDKAKGRYRAVQNHCVPFADSKLKPSVRDVPTHTRGGVFNARDIFPVEG